MKKIHLVIPDGHAKPGTSHERASYLSGLIRDVRPDVVVDMGDGADMPSLATYDKGKRNFVGRTYRADVDAFLEFQDRLWAPVKRSKKKLPFRVILEGNHEHRIERALDLEPILEGTISLSDLERERNYDVIVPYDGTVPGCITIDGITYGHYMVSGVSGRPLSGEHHGYSLLAKRFASSTVGHSHLLDYSLRHDGKGRPLHGLVAGCYIDYDMEWAGEMQNLWWSGVIIKRNVSDGDYDPEFVSLDRLRKEYGNA